MFGLKIIMQLIDSLFFRRKHYVSWISKTSYFTQVYFYFTQPNNILKFIDKITLENILFVNKSINRQVSPIFYDWFPFSGDLHRHETCWSVTDHLNIPTFWTQKYGRFSIRASTIYSWSSMQNLLINNLLVLLLSFLFTFEHCSNSIL